RHTCRRALVAAGSASHSVRADRRPPGCTAKRTRRSPRSTRTSPGKLTRILTPCKPPARVVVRLSTVGRLVPVNGCKFAPRLTSEHVELAERTERFVVSPRHGTGGGATGGLA